MFAVISRVGIGAPSVILPEIRWLNELLGDGDCAVLLQRGGGAQLVVARHAVTNPLPLSVVLRIAGKSTLFGYPALTGVLSGMRLLFLSTHGRDSESSSNTNHLPAAPGPTSRDTGDA